MRHHGYRALSRVDGRLVISRPVRDTSWWRRWKRERACRRTLGHCWHPGDGMIDWWCCECSAERDGMPGQTCKACIECAGGEL